MCGNNNSSTLEDSDSTATVVISAHLLPVYARVLLIAVYMAVVIVSVGGNALVIMVIAFDRRMRTVKRVSKDISGQRGAVYTQFAVAPWSDVRSKNIFSDCLNAL